MKLFKNKRLFLMIGLWMLIVSACSINNSSGLPKSLDNVTTTIQDKDSQINKPKQSTKQSTNTKKPVDKPKSPASSSKEPPKDKVSSITSPPSTINSNKEEEESSEMIMILISVGDKEFNANFYNNASTNAIISQMPFTIDMKDFSGQEKVTSLTFDLPKATSISPSTINAGEIYLWSENQLVIFYTTFLNSYSYVPIGYIEDVDELSQTLGSSNVEVVFRAKGVV